MNVLDRLDQQLQGWLDIFPASETVNLEIRLADLRALLDVARAADELIGANSSMEVYDKRDKIWDALAPLLEDTDG